MFSALRQGSILYILEKGEKPVLKIGQVVSITQPTYNNNFLMNASTLDINVKVGNQSMDFKNVPSSQSTANYNNVFISETKELMSTEVDNILQSSKSIIESVPYYTNVVAGCEEILKEINPQFAKDKERDSRLSSLEDRFGNVESKLDKIFELVKK